MRRNADAGQRYAPLWATLFGIAAAFVNRTGTRYIMERQLTFKPSDFLLSLAVAGFSYLTFRMRYGHAHEDAWYKR
jgi:hypothetical protein